MSQPEFLTKITLEATISPSEDPLKVAAAIGAVVGCEPSTVKLAARSARFHSQDPHVLSRFRDKLRDRHVRAAARRQLLVNSAGQSASMMLNRQAAAAGVVALCGTPGESPLGPIYVAIESERLGDAIDWLTAYEEG